MGWLEGQVVLVTGGGSGIGREIVARFITEGARVGVLERVPERIEQLKAAFGEYVEPVLGDVIRLELSSMDFRRISPFSRPAHR